MYEDHYGDLANLWAVGGRQADSKNRQRDRFYYQFCPGCGWRLTGKFSICPRCGADLRMRICLHCGGVVPAIAEICPRCTGPLN